MEITLQCSRYQDMQLSRFSDLIHFHSTREKKQRSQNSTPFDYSSKLGHSLCFVSCARKGFTAVCWCNGEGWRFGKLTVTKINFHWANNTDMTQLCDFWGLTQINEYGDVIERSLCLSVLCTAMVADKIKRFSIRS